MSQPWGSCKAQEPPLPQRGLTLWGSQRGVTDLRVLMSPTIPLERCVITLSHGREGVTTPEVSGNGGVSSSGRSHQIQHLQKEGSHGVGCPGPCCCHSTTQGYQSVGQHLSLPQPPSPEGVSRSAGKSLLQPSPRPTGVPFPKPPYPSSPAPRSGSTHHQQPALCCSAALCCSTGEDPGLFSLLKELY